MNFRTLASSVNFKTRASTCVLLNTPVIPTYHALVHNAEQSWSVWIGFSSDKTRMESALRELTACTSDTKRWPFYRSRPELVGNMPLWNVYGVEGST